MIFMEKFSLFFFMAFTSAIFSQTNDKLFNIEIERGEFTKARKMIDRQICEGDLSDSEVYELYFKKEILNRIQKDFSKTELDVLQFIQNYYPNATSEELKEWENKGSLEYKIIDGNKYYFNRAHGNLFRVDKEAKTQKIQIDGDKKGQLDTFLEKYLPEVVLESNLSRKSLVKPVKMRINYKLVVESDAVPAGETIRCWLPYPKENHARQHSVHLEKVSGENYIIAPDEYKQRTLYLEKIAVQGSPTEFGFQLIFTAENEYNNVASNNIKKYNEESDLYKEFTKELPPHIVFTDRIKKLSKDIVGDESDPMIVAKLIYKWINDNVPWAGAREYSTINNISEYCLSNGWGDCGIQTLTFMTLCRYNGIPTKWQSGWMLHPGETNLHDWCEIYFEGYGWLPVDQSFKLVDSKDENVRWFYFCNTDAFHFIVNDSYSQPLFPVKIYPRSETVDFQRGEVEWKGGNLYFDKWDYFMDVEYIDQKFE